MPAKHEVVFGPGDEPRPAIRNLEKPRLDPRSSRHELHQPLGAGMTSGPRIELALLPDQAEQNRFLQRRAQMPETGQSLYGIAIVVDVDAPGARRLGELDRHGRPPGIPQQGGGGGQMRPVVPGTGHGPYEGRNVPFSTGPTKQPDRPPEPVRGDIPSSFGGGHTLADRDGFATEADLLP